MKVLYVFRSLAMWGGIERILVEKMNYLSKVYGYDVYMLTSDQGNHPVPYHLEDRVHLEDLNIRFHQQYQYSFLRRLWVANRLKRLYEKRLTEHIRQIQPNIIICTTADHIDSLGKLKGSIPLVVESHSICLRTIEDGRNWMKRKWYRFHYLKALSKVDVVVALTEGDAAEWRKVHPNVIVIPNLVHLNNGVISKLENKRVIFVGRFDYQKQPMEMIRVWKKIHPMYPDWQLDIYGEGEQKRELEDIIRSSGMKVVLHHPTEHIFNCYRESSILVSTSLFEPFGLVIPEAMSCGLPVVAYDCPYGPASIISNGENGYLINFGAIKTFAEKVSILMDSIELRKKMGTVGAIASRNYEPSRVMPLWIALFHQLLNR